MANAKRKTVYDDVTYAEDHGMSDLIEAHIAALRAQGRSQSTIEDRRKMLRRLDRELPYGLEKTNEDEIALWLGQEDWAPETRSSYYSHLVGFYRWATGGRRPHLDYDPTADLPRPHVVKGLPRPLTDAEVTLAMERLPQGYPRDAATLALGAGMRCCEITRAEGAHLVEGFMRILGKGGKERLVPACPEVQELVHERGPGLLVRRPLGTKWLPDNLSQAMSTAFADIGLQGVTLHRLRHTFATRLVRKKANIVAVKNLLGHASLNTTQIYAQVVGEDLVEAMEQQPRFRPDVRSGRRGPGKTTPTTHASDQESAA
jgi:site-specific recombinase XerD